jgi:site-specific recombinase XerD
MITAQPNALARTLRQFFSDHLPGLRGLSHHTIDSYRYALILLLRFMAHSRGRRVAELDLADLDAEDVIAFLDHLEQERHNTVATRNVRLAALHAFFRYVAITEPEQLARSQRILRLPFKRADQRTIDYLEYEELQAVLAAVDRTTGMGRRDYALLATMFNTGGRVQEIVNLRACDLQLERPFQVRLFGKGQKERFCPLWPQTALLLRELCSERQLDLRAASPLFINHRGQPLSRFGVGYILDKYLKRAQASVTTLRGKRLHPHSMRHSTAVHLLKSGVDLSTIGQWLGHDSLNTTNKYVAIDLDLKRQALARADSPATEPLASWRHDATILEWLESL